ncbi:zinc finger protein 84-like [Anopheles merus]|uniref:zinc finger protein 84-like n=1 Tax=Anopheles merus TaxID=30066 RepID=UPI001BE48F38|nr:zinc finger protein 84-like [Anopheles merus]
MYQNILCRVCATTETACVLVDNFDKQCNQPSVADLLCELAGLEVRDDDGLPQHCCIECYTELVKAASVRRKCIESDKLIRTYIESSLVNAEELCEVQIDDESNVSSEDEHDAAAGKSGSLFRCYECCIDFHNSERLRQHYESKHASAIYGWHSFGISETSLFDSTDEDVEDEEDETEIRPETMRRGKSLFAIENPEYYRCCGCKDVFDTKAELEEHSDRMHAPFAAIHTKGKPYKCNICYSGFSQLRGVKAHQIMYSFPRFLCIICGQLCCTLKHLMHHERTHSEPSYSCADCGKEFVHEMQLRNHREAKHLDKNARKKYVCDVCGKELLAKVSLRKHTLVMHSGERPYACNLCDARFQIKAYLTSHMAVHNRLHTCGNCDKSFPCQKALIEHMRSHTGELAEKCPLCPAMFRQKNSVRKHLKAAHQPNSERKRKYGFRRVTRVR